MLRQTFDSILSQTYHGDDVELIVSNDCSKDDTEHVIAEYQNRFKNFRCFSHSANLGGAKNWEFLLKEARGEFVYMLSDDDVIAPSFLAEYLQLISDLPELDLIFSGLELRDRDLEFVATYPVSQIHGPTDGITRLKDQLRAHHMVISAAYRREIFLKAGGWDPSVGTHLDCTAFCRMAMRSRVAVYIPKSLLYYRITPGSWASFSVEKQSKLAAWYRRKLDLLLADAKTLHPDLATFIEEMYLWHAKGMVYGYEIELAHGRITGSEVRRAMSAVWTSYPEGRYTLAATKLLIATYLGTGWLTGTRKLLGKPNPYESQFALFGKHASANKIT